MLVTRACGTISFTDAESFQQKEGQNGYRKNQFIRFGCFLDLALLLAGAGAALAIHLPACSKLKPLILKSNASPCSNIGSVERRDPELLRLSERHVIEGPVRVKILRHGRQSQTETHCYEEESFCMEADILNSLIFMAVLVGFVFL